MLPDVARKLDCNVGRETLTTEPSMKASEEPRIVATSIHLRSLGAHGEAVSAELTAVQGGRTGDLGMTIVVTVHRCAQIGNVADTPPSAQLRQKD